MIARHTKSSWVRTCFRFPKLITLFQKKTKEHLYKELYMLLLNRWCHQYWHSKSPSKMAKMDTSFQERSLNHLHRQPTIRNHTNSPFLTSLLPQLIYSPLIFFYPMNDEPINSNNTSIAKPELISLRSLSRKPLISCRFQEGWRTTSVLILSMKVFPSLKNTLKSSPWTISFHSNPLLKKKWMHLS